MGAGALAEDAGSAREKCPKPPVPCGAMWKKLWISRISQLRINWLTLIIGWLARVMGAGHVGNWLMTHQATAYLVDDDAGDRHHLAFRLGAVGIEAWPFTSAESFLHSLEGLRPQLLLIAVEAPPHGGSDIMSFLKRREIDWPVIALTRSREVDLAVGTMKMGVFDYLTKPVDEERLVASVREGADLLASRLRARQVKSAAEARVTSLTAREISICRALLAGQPNKLIAHHLGISIRTVEAHRSNIMMKLNVRSIAEAFLLLSQAGITPEASPPPAMSRRLPHLPPLRELETGAGLRGRDYPAAA